MAHGRIHRPEQSSGLDLPEAGRLHIGMKKMGQNGKEYPVSVDYFIPSGKYAGMFTAALGDKPATIQIIFPDDDPAKVCNERYEYRDNTGALVARGDGQEFEVWNGKKYIPVSTEKYPDIMQQICEKYPTRRGGDNWDIALTMRFIIPAVRGIIGVWVFSTRGKASSMKNIINSFDGVKMLRGTITNSVFDLSVAFAKSNKPNQNNRYPVVTMIANDLRINEIREELKPNDEVKLLL